MPLTVHTALTAAQEISREVTDVRTQNTRGGNIEVQGVTEEKSLCMDMANTTVKSTHQGILMAVRSTFGLF